MTKSVKNGARVMLDGEGFYKRQIDRVKKDATVKAVVLRVDTPGGSIADPNQLEGGSIVGTGTDNGTLTPYQEVFTDFERYAQTSLDRGYVPLSVKDYVRDYFSSLDPSN